MKLQGKVTDSRTGEALPSVSVFSADSSLTQLGDGTTTDASGNYVFDSANLDNPDNVLGFSSAGYQPVYVSVNPAATTLDMALDETGSLTDVVVTAKKVAKKAVAAVVNHVSSNKTVYYIIGAAALLGIGFFVYKRFKK
jgi:LPXTG-motif cell wall-anchored protein